MPKVNPIGMLNTKAHNMIAGYITNSPDKHKYAKEFFEFANKYNVQGPAIVSYFTKLHNIECDYHFNNNHSANNIRSFKKYVRNLIAPVQKEGVAVEQNGIVDVAEIEAKAEAEKFVKNLNKMYDKKLRARISIADQGAVSSEVIEKISWKTKALVRVNLMLEKLMNKFEPIAKLVEDFCKPVE